MTAAPFSPAGPEDIFLIADIGKNFIQTADDRPVEEYVQNAKRLIDAAALSGVDAVKFQTHDVSDEQLDLPVEAPHFRGHDRYAWVRRNTAATPIAFWRELKAHCLLRNVLFCSTPMSRRAAEKLTEVGVPFWKVASGDVRDHVLLSYLASTRLPIIFSTGMVSLAELDDVVAHLRTADVPLAVLYCVSKYPCPPAAFNLATLERLRAAYPDLTVGFSDHSLGHDVALAAVKAGARIVEKHFSFSRDLWGPDHKASMTPEEMTALVRAVRGGAHRDVDVASYWGDPEKELEGAESEFRPYFYKSLVAARTLPAGTVLAPDMLHAMRPHAFAGGLLADQLEAVIGRKIVKNMQEYDVLTPAHLSS